jgi:hypothetical protein
VRGYQVNGNELNATSDRLKTLRGMVHALFHHPDQGLLASPFVLRRIIANGPAFHGQGSAQFPACRPVRASSDLREPIERERWGVTPRSIAQGLVLILLL